MKIAKIGVLVSGRSRGTNFGAMMDSISRDELHAEIALLIATNEEHGAVTMAREVGIPTLILPPENSATQEEWDHLAADALYEAGASFIALAGYLRRITGVLLEAYPRRILNVHPSLLPAFGGEGMYGQRVHRAVLEHGCKISGCTVHLVDERYDTGPIVAQACVPVEDDDTPETLSARVLKQEHRLYSQCLELLVQDKIRCEGRRVKKR